MERRLGVCSAQRLTAIRGKSLTDCLSSPMEKSLRAQRLTAIRGKSRVTVRVPAQYWFVLNALRQSEENHIEQIGYCLSSTTTCSTPYGNQRKITWGHGWQVGSKSCAQRLTAIRGKSLPQHHHPIGVEPRAQRLTAIRGKSHTQAGRTGQGSQVLNALRQSEENHGPL